jgi:hypothetical protein
MELLHPRMSVRWLMLVVVLVAINFAIIRGIRGTGIDIGIAFVTLPMASILLLAAPRAWGGDATRRFWIGFEIAGWSMVVLFGYLSHHNGAAFFRPANSVYPWGTIRNREFQLIYLMFIDFIFYTPPQVLVAWFTGRVLAKHQSRLERIPSHGPR